MIIFVTWIFNTFVLILFSRYDISDSLTWSCIPNICGIKKYHYMYLISSHLQMLLHADVYWICFVFLKHAHTLISLHPRCMFYYQQHCSHRHNIIHLFYDLAPYMFFICYALSTYFILTRGIGKKRKNKSSMKGKLSSPYWLDPLQLIYEW